MTWTYVLQNIGNHVIIIEPLTFVITNMTWAKLFANILNLGLLYLLSWIALESKFPRSFWLHRYPKWLRFCSFLAETSIRPIEGICITCTFMHNMRNENKWPLTHKTLCDRDGHRKPGFDWFSSPVRVTIWCPVEGFICRSCRSKGQWHLDNARGRISSNGKGWTHTQPLLFQR